MESGGPSRDEEEIIYEEELPPSYVEERVERLGTWLRVAAGLAVLAAAVGVVALVFALRANDGEELDPAEVERIERQVLDLSSDLDEVSDELAEVAALEEPVDELSESVEDLDARLTRVATSARTLSRRLDNTEDEAGEREGRIDRTVDGLRELSDRVDGLEEQ